MWVPLVSERYLSRSFAHGAKKFVYYKGPKKGQKIRSETRDKIRVVRTGYARAACIVWKGILVIILMIDEALELGPAWGPQRLAKSSDEAREGRGLVWKEKIGKCQRVVVWGPRFIWRF